MKQKSIFPRTLLLTAALAMAATAGAQTSSPSELDISFYRPGTSATEVTVSLADADGTPIEGASASIAITTNDEASTLKTTANSVTDAILCPDTNGSTGAVFVFTLTLSDLPEGFSFNTVDASLWALNASGDLQNVNTVRTWDIALSQGADTDNLSEFASGSYDLTESIPYTAQFSNESAVTVSSDGSLVIQMTASLTSTDGCYIGLETLRLYTASDDDTAGDEVEPVTFTVNTANGTVASSTGSPTYYNSWTSTQTDPQLTFTISASNMLVDNDGNLILNYVTSGINTYTLTIARGWVISSYSFTLVNGSSETVSITTEDGETYTAEVGGSVDVSVTDINSQTASITINASTNVTPATLKDFTVTVVPSDDEDAASITELFVTTSSSIPYRIPAITRMKDGSLLAVADYRYCGADIGYGHIDIVGRISSDNGATWGKEILIADGSGNEGAYDCGYGDAALVTDSATGHVLMICCTGNITYGSSTRSNPLRTARLYSYDGGQNWTDPEDITEYIYGLFDQEDGTSIAGLFFGSGRIAQSSLVKVGDYYRVYAALCTRSGNRVVYSDDFGQTWEILGGINAAPAPSGDEPKCEELPDGSVLLSSRKSSGRYFNVFSFTNLEEAEGSWSTAVASNDVTGGISVGANSTNGEILIVPAVRNADGKEVYLALQSIPFASSRANVGIWYKGLETFSDFDTPTNFASDWEGSYQVTSLGSAYSTMVMQADGKVAFVYEESTYSASYTIIYTPLTIEAITDSAYSLAADADVDRWALLAESIDEKSTFTPGTFVGQLTEEGVAALQSYVEAFAASPSQESYYAIMAQTVNPDNLWQIDTTTIYRIYNVRAGEYISGINLLIRASTGRITGEVITGSASGSNALNTLWQFVSDGNGNYMLRNLNADAYFLAATSQSSVTDIESASIFEVGEGASSDNWTFYVTNGTSSTYTYLNAYYSSTNSEHTIATYSGGSSDQGNLWMIEPVNDVTLTIDESGYAAVTYPFAVELPEGLTAYSLIQESGDLLIIEEIDTDVLPAGTPALFGGEAGDYTLAFVTGNEDDALATGFEGVAVRTVLSTNDNLYVLGTQDDVVGMISRGSKTMTANTTYYATATEDIEFFTLTTEIPVGIDQISADTESDAPTTYYDLSGRKVNKPARGIYVTSDGKKVLLK